MRAFFRATAAVVLVLICVLIVKATIPSVPTGTWVAGPALSEARTGATATLMPDGRVLIAGGKDANGNALASADLFNADGSITAAPPMSTARYGHAAIFLMDGYVLVAGGHTTGGSVVNTAELFDPLTNTWQTLGSMSDPRAEFTMSQLQDGDVLLAGGDNGSAPLSSFEKFVLTANSFQHAGALVSARKSHAAATLNDGRVIITGGSGLDSSSNATALNTTEIYDPASNSVSAGPALITARFAHSATTLIDGTVLLTGGNDGANDLASAEIYDPAAGTITASASSLATPRSNHTALLLPNNNSVLITGGTSAGTDLKSTELYQSWNHAFIANADMSVARANAVSSAVATDGVALLAGGSNESSTEFYGFATVKTDQHDYVPGETVTITGSGWTPGETVTLTLLESPTLDTHGPYTVVADASGNILNTDFAVDSLDYKVRFYLTAAGSQSSSQAQNTFTDATSFGNPSVGQQSPATGVLPGNPATFPVTLNFNGNGICTASLSVVSGLPAGTTSQFVPGSGTGTSSADSISSTLTLTPNAGTTPNSYTFTVRATGTAGDCNGNTRTGTGTLIVSGPATTLQLSGFPATVTAGTPGNFTVTARDSHGNVAVGYTGAVHFTSTDLQAVPPGNYTFTAADKGVHTFSATLGTAGTQSISATDTVAGTITGTQSGITVSAGATAKLAVTGYASPVTAGTSNSFNVTAQDAFGNLTTGYTGTVHFTSTDGSAVLPANYTFTSGPGNKDNGAHTFNATFNTAGTQSITATDTANASITGTQPGIIVNSNVVATTLAVAAPSPASVQFATSGPVTFSATLTRTTGGAAVVGATVNFTVDGTAAGSGVTNASGVATFSTYNPSALSVGSHNVQASFTAASISGTSYSASTSGTQTLGISLADQTIAFGALPTKTYGDAPFTVSATGGTSGNPVTFTAGPAAVCTASGTNGSTITIVGGGGCTVTAHQAANANYNAAPDVPQSFTVNKADATITVTGYNGPYTATPHGATGSASGLQGIDLSSLLHVATTTYTDAPGGLVHWTFDGNTNYNATSGDAQVTITKVDATISVTGYSGPYTAAPHGATGTATGLLAADLSSLLHVATTTYTDVPGGLVHWTFDGNINYNATSGDAQVTITKVDATVSVTGYSGPYTATPHGATGTATGLLAADLSSLLHVATTTYTDVPGGLVHWTFDGNTNYNATSGDAPVTITKVDASVSVSGYSGPYTATAHGASGAATGLLGADLNSLLHVDATTYTDVPGGLVHWTFDGNTNYNPSSGNAQVTITKIDANVNVTGYSGPYTASPHGASGTAIGLLNADLNSLLHVAGTTYTDVPGGLVHWTFDGNTNYNPASGDATVTITKVDATIMVTGYNGPYTASAHGATGSAIGLLGTDLGSLLHVAATTYTDVPGGLVHWTFDGNTNYNSAAGDAEVTITRIDATISVTGYDGPYTATPHGATGTATGLLAADLSGLLHVAATTYTDVPGGLVHWTFDGNTNYNPASGDAAVTITKVNASVSVTGYNGPYTATAHGASGTATGVSGADLNSLLHVDSTTYTDVPGGLVHWTFDGNTNYNPAFGDAAVTITKIDATISVSGYNGPYTASPHGASGSAGGLQNANLNSLLHIDSTTYTDVPGGSVHWTFDGNTNYNSASGEATVTITKVDATINVTGYNGPYTATAHGASGTATGLSGADLNSLLHVANTTYTDAPGGLVHWTFDGNTNYNSAGGDASVTITKINASITVTGYSGPYTATPHGASGSASGLNAVDLSGLLHVDPTTYTDVPGGQVHWAFDGNTNYNAATGSAMVTITKVDATISVTPYNVIWDGAAHTATGTATGVNGVDLNASLNLASTTHTAVGDYPNDPWTFNGGTNYNNASGTVHDVIKAWTLTGFYQPISMSSGGLIVWNTIKGGQTVPVKFNIYAGTVEQKTLAAVPAGSITLYSVICGAGGIDDPVDVANSGSTSLRYDSLGGQFIQNWQTPKGAGQCLMIRMTAADGSKLDAYFKTK